MSISTIISFVLRAVAVGMAVAVLVISILGSADVESMTPMLAIGLFTLALDALNQGKEPA